MEVLTRTHKVRRPGGVEVVVREFREMVDHGALRTGTDGLPGGRRYALSDGQEVRRLDEFTFQIISTGEVLRLTS